jgi:hypothetical protein
MYIDICTHHFFHSAQFGWNKKPIWCIWYISYFFTYMYLIFVNRKDQRFSRACLFYGMSLVETGKKGGREWLTRARTLIHTHTHTYTRMYISWKCTLQYQKQFVLSCLQTFTGFRHSRHVYDLQKTILVGKSVWRFNSRTKTTQLTLDFHIHK